MYEKLGQAATFIQAIRKTSPKIGLILGSGLGVYVNQIEDKTVIPYDEIPFFHPSTVDGHEGRLIIGKVNGIEVAVLQGRIHSYEGYSMEDIVFPTRLLATLGAESIILTNAAGGINTSYNAGNLVIIEDHINLMGNNPLIGPNIAELGPRFPDMTYAYDRDIINIFKSTAENIGLNIKTGVYCGLQGPTYETPAEVRMLRTLGADMVGMSTVPESIAANHLGIRVGGISCITNMAAGITGNKLDHKEVKDQALEVMETFSKLLSGSIKKIANLE